MSKSPALKQFKYLLLLAISGTVITVDQVTKMYIHTQFRLGQSVEIIPEFFNFTYVRNYGAAFGILSTSQPTFRDIFFLAMPPVAMIVILLILKVVPNRDRVQITGLYLVFGGAIGNYIDRVRFKYVIDFLDVHIKDKYVWPAFNIADSAIVVGVCMLLLLMFFEKSEEDKKKAAQA